MPGGVYALYIVNKSGGLVYTRNFLESRTSQISSNDRLRLAGVFHALHAIAAQCSPVASGGKSGINTIFADTFTLECFEALTRTKFFIVTSPQWYKTGDAKGLLKRIYVAYTDFVLKNPFYEVEMPIKAGQFDSEVDLIARTTA